MTGDQSPPATTGDPGGSALQREPAKWQERLEVSVAIMLGVAATLTAFASYQASLADGDALKKFNEGVILSNDSNRKYIETNQIFTADQELFLEYATLIQAGNEESADYVRDKLMRTELEESIDEWAQLVEAAPSEDEAPLSPFEEPGVEIAELGEAEKLGEASKAKFTDANGDDKKGDDLTLATVVLALSLFLLGIAGVLNRLPVQIGVAAGGTVVTVIGAVMLLMNL